MMWRRRWVSEADWEQKDAQVDYQKFMTDAGNNEGKVNRKPMKGVQVTQSVRISSSEQVFRLMDVC